MNRALPNFTVLLTGMSKVWVRAESLSIVRSTTVFMSSITIGFSGSGGSSGGTSGLTSAFWPGTSASPGFSGMGAGFWRGAEICAGASPLYCARAGCGQNSAVSARPAASRKAEDLRCGEITMRRF